jgi:Ca-activated chloride channel family protein
MTVAASAAVLRTAEGAPVPLQTVAVRAALRDLLAEVEVVQTYRNDETVPIEAVYSFPLPVEAVLLDVSVRLGERRLSGRVVARGEAERAYERAIVAGDAAVMIERPEPGLYVMNVGNLLPGAEAEVCFRYALVLRWQRDQLRFTHPTTIAPRYGRWALEPHQIPEASLLTDNDASLEVEISGLLAGARFASPSHELEIGRGEGRTVIRLRGGRMLMDRDFVLDIRAENAPRTAILRAADVDGGEACLAILHPQLPVAAEAPPRDLKIVLDCSGSMQGDSIGQARVAVARILEQLRPQDRFTIVLFGSQHRLLFSTMVAGDDVTIAAATRELQTAMADMGGTEMGAALQAAYGVPVRSGSMPTLILVTDGEITDAPGVVRAARASRHRLFTVGVGSAVAEGLLRDLAGVSGGACELVAPREDMAERIVRHFRRIDAGGARLAVDWPALAMAVFGADESVFSGDTAVLFGRFSTLAEGEAHFTLTLPDGQRVIEHATIPPASESGEGPSTIARLLAARELFELGIALDAAAAAERSSLEARAAALAERYQLLSPWTNWLLVVAQANEQAGDLPALRKVSQMLAAGWGGVGRMQLRSFSAVSPILTGDSVSAAPAPAAPARAALFQRRPVAPPASAPRAGLRKIFDGLVRPGAGSPKSEPAGIDASALRRFIEAVEQHDDAAGIDGLARVPGIPLDVGEALQRLVQRGFEERDVIVAFLALLVDSRRGRSLDRGVRRLALKLERSVRPPREMRKEVAAALARFLDGRN